MNETPKHRAPNNELSTAELKRLHDIRLIEVARLRKRLGYPPLIANRAKKGEHCEQHRRN